MKTQYELYHGYDCSSIDGFNNGCVIDRECYTTDIDAYLLALKPHWAEVYDGLTDSSDDTTTLAYITGYYDCDGNELTKEQFSDRDNDDDSYRYEFITATKLG